MDEKWWVNLFHMKNTSNTLWKMDCLSILSTFFSLGTSIDIYVWLCMSMYLYIYIHVWNYKMVNMYIYIYRDINIVCHPHSSPTRCGQPALLSATVVLKPGNVGIEWNWGVLRASFLKWGVPKVIIQLFDEHMYYIYMEIVIIHLSYITQVFWKCLLFVWCSMKYI